MNQPLHSLQIGTLATWLSVASIGAVGFFASPVPQLRIPEAEASASSGDFTLGTAAEEFGENQPQESTPPAPSETFPAPPAEPETSDFEPLPEIPDLPQTEPQKPISPPTRKNTQPTGQSTKRSQPATSTRPPKSSGGNSGNSSNSGSSGSSTGSGSSSVSASGSSRLSGGYMPPPTYPPNAKQKKQTGTVIVEFTIDTSGRVTSSRIKTPCPWPELNSAAVNAVRRWKFPPGPTTTLSLSVIFKLR